MKFISIKNNQTINEKDIPILPYDKFFNGNIALLENHIERHCVNYFGVKNGNGVKIYSCIADDRLHEIYIFAAMLKAGEVLPSLTAQNHNFEKFEREVAENFGLNYTDHPWLKPVRYAFNRADKTQNIADYPFYQADSEELHEVGVGPIHAGVIEPGHFRFICNGEQILHLEIQLGYQHRGIEQLFIEKSKLLQRATLAENIAGDTVAGHTSTFANLWESLCGMETPEALHFSRTLAQELERIAIHTGDLSAICADIAYQLGNAVFGRLRTPVINFLQEWSGNRFAKGLIRPGKINYPFNNQLKERMLSVFEAYEPHFNEMASQMFHLPSVLARLERTGIVTYEQVLEIGTVGMPARMSGLERDIRKSHPYNNYGQIIKHTPVIKHHGDVYSRAQIRREEIKQSVEYCKKLTEKVPVFEAQKDMSLNPGKNKFTLSLTEGWRGEICHCAITGEQGELVSYKIKDPSHHNWMALAQAVRNNEISDFPINNKSFNLSYCGHDL